MEDLDELINRILEAARRQQQQIGVLMVDTFHSCLLAPWKCEVNCGKPGEGRQGHFNANISGDMGNMICTPKARLVNLYLLC